MKPCRHFRARRSGLLVPSAVCHITSDLESSTGTPADLGGLDSLPGREPLR